MKTIEDARKIQTEFEIDDVRIKVYNVFKSDIPSFDSYGYCTLNNIMLETGSKSYILATDLFDYNNVLKVWEKDEYDLRYKTNSYIKTDYRSIRELFEKAKEKCPELQNSLKELSECKQEYVKITKYAYGGYVLKILKRYEMFSANKSDLEYFIKDFANNKDYIFLKETSLGEFRASDRETYCSQFLKDLFNNKNNFRTEILEILNYRKLDDKSHNLLLKGLESIDKQFEDRNYMRQFTPGTIKLYCYAPITVKLFIQAEFFDKYDYKGHFCYEIEDIERKEKPSRRISFFGNKNKTPIDIKIPYYIMDQGIIKRDYIDISDKVEFVKEDDYNRIELKVLKDIEYDEIGIRTHYYAGSAITVSKIPCEDRYNVRFVDQFKYFEEIYGKTAGYYSILNHYLDELAAKNPSIVKIDTAIQIEEGINRTAINCCLDSLKDFDKKSLDDIQAYIDRPVIEMINFLKDEYSWDKKLFEIKNEINKAVDKIQDKIYNDLVKEKDTSYPSITYYNLLTVEPEKHKLNDKTLNLAVEKILNGDDEIRNELIEDLDVEKEPYASEIWNRLDDKNRKIIKDAMVMLHNHENYER